MMHNFPRNVAEFLYIYKSKMKGYEATIAKVKQSVEQFRKLREQSSILQRIEVFQCQHQGKSFSQLYQVKIKGRKNTYYHCRVLSFYIFFFDGFPEEPPEIIAPYYIQQQSYKPFLHLNMDGNGHVCTQSNQKDKQYFKSTTLKDILIQLENMIYNPNISSSYPSELFSCYKEKGDNSEYFMKLNRQAAFLESFEEDESSQSDSQSDND